MTIRLLQPHPTGTPIIGVSAAPLHMGDVCSQDK